MITFYPDNIETKQFYIYKITYQNGKPFYIGKGQNCRYKSHFKNGNTKLKKFIKQKLKSQSLRVVIIKDNLTEDKAFDLERRLIDRYGRKDNNTGVLYNRTSGGQGPSGVVYAEGRNRKISETLKGNKRSKETKRKISESKKGYKQTKEHIRKRSQSMKGNKNTLGYNHTEETKRQISESMKGKKKSEEHKIKMIGNKNGSGLKGIKKSEEHKRNISKALKQQRRTK